MMLALEVYRSVSRYTAAKALGGRMPGLLVGPMAPVRLVTTDEPRVRHTGWARVRPSLSGICGSDLGVITGATSLYFAALASMPYVPGHEMVGTLLDDCVDLPKGTRVVLEPVLSCAARGLTPCDQCAEGRTNLCDRITVGHVAPGLQTGFCSDTGGGWGEEMMAHRSQLHPVPDDAPGRARRAGRAARLRGPAGPPGRGAAPGATSWSPAPERSACSPRWRCAS